MNRQIGPAHSLRNPSPPAGKPRLRLTVSKRGAGTPSPRRRLAYAAVFVRPRRRARKGFRNDGAAPGRDIHD